MSYKVSFDVTIHDLPKCRACVAKIKPVIPAAGGRYLVRGGAHTAIEGDWKPTRLVIFEFPSLAAAQSFYVSPSDRRRLPCVRDCADRGIEAMTR